MPTPDRATSAPIPLAIKFDGRLGKSVRFKVPLCLSGGVDVGFRHLKARVPYVRTGGS